MYKTFITLVLILLLDSCSYKDINKAEKELYNKIVTYQYHNYYATNDFSFLSKYKNLKALDLSDSNVTDLSFIKKLPKLELLILENTDIEKDEINKNIYANNFKNPCYYNYVYINKNIKDCNKLLAKYSDLYFYLNENILKFIETDNVVELSNILSTGVNDGFNPLEVKKLNFFKRLRRRGVIKFSNISGILRFINLEKLKMVLNNDKYIDLLSNLKNLKELHLAGNIYSLPIFQKSLEKLYLYNTKVENFSFLKNSNIKELYIVTKNFKSKKWNVLKKKYPKIKIDIKSLLFMPLYSDGYCIIYDKNKSYLAFEDIYIVGNCEAIENLRKDILDIKVSDVIIRFMSVYLGINKNYIWEDSYSGEKVTFLDKAIESKNKSLVRYLFNFQRFSSEPKRACEILKTKCIYIPKDIQLIIDKKAVIYHDENDK